MTKVRDICRLFEELAPLKYQESYDNSGLQTGDPEDEVRGVLLCLDVSLPVVEEAIEKGCNLIISHHPLLFFGIKRLTPQTAQGRCLMTAVRGGVSIYAAHTNLDSVREGVNAKICEKLGLSPLGFLAPVGDPAVSGSGMLAQLPRAMDEAAFLEMVKRVFGCAVLRHSALSGKPVRKVAVCGGSGGEFLDAAMQAGADVYLTADLKYHQFQAAEGRLLLVDAGHFETEQFTKEIFYDLLSKNITTFAPQIAEREENPVRYV